MRDANALYRSPTCLQKAYLAYVKNCAFTSAQSWPLIHLMRRSLVELYSIDPTVSYQRAFLYIRQLAIHLRNAKLDKKKVGCFGRMP